MNYVLAIVGICFALGMVGVILKAARGYERTIRSMRTQIDILRYNNRQLNDKVSILKYEVDCKDDKLKARGLWEESPLSKINLNPVLSAWFNN